MIEDLRQGEARTDTAPVARAVGGGSRGVRLYDSLHDLTLRAANRLFLFRLLRILTVERVHPDYLRCPAPYVPAFLDETSLREHSRDPGNDLSPSFLEEALGKGDECFGIVAGDTLAAYGWYTRGPTRIHPQDLVLRVEGSHVYMYKGYTRPAHRGRHLHTFGMNLALQHYLTRGFAGLVSYIESNNFRALRAARRMGYAEIATVAVLRIFGAYTLHRSAGCRALGLRIDPVARLPG